MQKFVNKHSRGAMQFLKLYPILSYSPLNNLSSNTSISFLSLFSTVSSPTQALEECIFIIDHLNTNFKFSKTQSIYISKRVLHARCPQKPLSVLNFFKQNGFSETQIQSMICQKPQILFSDINKTLKPKIEFFQLLGFEGSELHKFLSKNSTIFTCSLNKTLVPSVETIRKIAYNEKDFIQVLHRAGRILPKRQKILCSVAFFKSCGIVGSQLLLLLKEQSWLFVASESLLRNLVLRAVNMGFDVNSRMLVHALHTISGLSIKTFERKLELIQSYGFSEDESRQMFRRAPVLLRTSEEKLKVGIEVFLHTIMLPKSVLVHRPQILMYSMEDRVIPRYKVLQLLVSENVLKKHPSFIKILELPEGKFLEEYISRFRGIAEALLVAYKGHLLEAASTS